MTQWEREEEQLMKDFDRGLISRVEYNKQMRDLERYWREEAQAAAEQAAEDTYNDMMGFY